MIKERPWVGELRSQFPAANEYAFFDIAYENCGARFQEEAAAEYFRDKSDIYPGIVKAGGSGKGRTIDVINETRSLAVSFLNAPSVKNLAFTLNTTQGMNLLLQSLEWRGRGPDGQKPENIVVCDIEHVAVLLPCLHLREKGFEVRVVKAENGLYVTAEDLLNAADEDTKVIALSYVQSSSGYRTDLKYLCEEAHRRGIFVITDAIQALGFIPLDVQDLGVDGLCTCCYKGLLATEGAGFVYCSDRLLPALHPVFAGPNEASRFDRDKCELTIDRTDARMLEAGTLPFEGIYVLRSGLKRLLSIGMDEISAHIGECCDEILAGLDRLGIKTAGCTDPAHRCHSLLLCTGSCEGGCAALTRALAERKVFVSQGKEGFIRISVSPFTTAADVKKLLDALGSCYNV